MELMEQGGRNDPAMLLPLSTLKNRKLHREIQRLDKIVGFSSEAVLGN